MDLKEKLNRDMVEALKAKEKIRLSTVRMLISAIKYAEIEKKAELTDEDMLEVTRREIKKRKESIEEYKKGNRPDLVKKEEEEAKVLEVYLPPQLKEEEIEAIVREAIDETQAIGSSDFGKVMGIVMPKVKGKADGKRVNEIARRLLA